MELLDTSSLKRAFLDLVARRQTEAPKCRLIGFGVSRHRHACDKLDAERLLDMPISEEAILGVAVGLSRVGAETFVDLMFEAFAARGWDVLTNQAAISALRGGNAPLTVRLLSVLSTAAGPQHGGAGYGLLARLPHVMMAATIAAADVERAWAVGRAFGRPLLLLTPDRIPADTPELFGEGDTLLSRFGTGGDIVFITPGIYAAIVVEAITLADAWARTTMFVPLFLNPLPIQALTSVTAAARRTVFIEGPPPPTIGDRLACERWAVWDEESALDASRASARLAERMGEWLRT
jgi:transketolase C-terminal domain/subunit